MKTTPTENTCDNTPTEIKGLEKFQSSVSKNNGKDRNNQTFETHTTVLLLE